MWSQKQFHFPNLTNFCGANFFIRVIVIFKVLFLLMKEACILHNFNCWMCINGWLMSACKCWLHIYRIGWAWAAFAPLQGLRCIHASGKCSYIPSEAKIEITEWSLVRLCSKQDHLQNTNVLTNLKDWRSKLIHSLHLRLCGLWSFKGPTPLCRLSKTSLIEK